MTSSSNPHDNDDLSPPVMQVTDEELAANQIPLHARDGCAHLLIPLNRCRRENYYNRLKCHDERHSYEACLYKDFLRRQKVMTRMKEAEQKDGKQQP